MNMYITEGNIYLQNINTKEWMNVKDENIKNLEREMLEKINALGIGAEGFRGDVTALRVFIETENTHIAGLPVAVTVQCHCSRHGERIIEG